MTPDIELKVYKTHVLIFWVAWLALPWGITYLLEPNIYIENREIFQVLSDKWCRLVILFALSVQLSSGLAIKLFSKTNPLYTEIKLKIGPRALILNAGARLPKRPRLTLTQEDITNQECNEAGSLDEKIRDWSMLKCP